jgi:signal transduction histidine kinase
MSDVSPDTLDPATTAHLLRQRDRQLQAVVSVTRALQTRLHLDELIKYAVLTAMATMDADAGSLLLHDPECNKLVFRYVEGPAKAKITGMEIADTQGVAGDVFQTARSRISLDVTQDRAHITDIDKHSSYTTRSMITVPLQAGTGEVLGVIQVLNKHEGEFNESDMEVLEVLAAQVAATILNAQLFEKAQVAAMVDLLGQMSHDIKNLLTPVQLSGQTLRMMMNDFQAQVSDELVKSTQNGTPLGDTIDCVMQRIGSDVDEIFSILEESTQIAVQRSREIADTVKGLSAAPTFEMVDLNEIARRVCRVLCFVAEKNGVTLIDNLLPLPLALLDSKRLYNVLYNLVNNAIGATPAGGRVTLRTSAMRMGEFPDGNFLQIEVADTGCGMPPETAEKLFTGRVRSTKKGGTGLGTRVVKSVVDAHNGVLSVKSTLGAGTTITARIPLRTEAGRA